ncbi:MAG TPA: hypothetical protein VIN60_10330 [Anaerolineales bacterium]
MKKWLIPLGITCGVILFGIIICVIVSSLGLFHLAQSLPTPAPTAALVIGHDYWVSALIPPLGMPAGLVLRYAELFNKPGNPINDPSVTLTAMIPDATELTLVATQQNWCYVRGTYNFMQGINIPTLAPPMPTPDFTKPFEGWMECNRLLDYAPTPYPTPNSTPQPP